MAISVYTQIEDNKKKSWIIMTFFAVIITTIVFIFTRTSGSGWFYAGFALLLSGLMSLGSLYWSDKIVLAMSHAKEANRSRETLLYSVTDHITAGAKLPKPKVYIIEDSAPNAFATGRDPEHSVICVTRGLIDKLDRKELEAVVAHEMSHIQNYDIRVMAIVAVLAGMVVILSDQLLRMFIWGGSRNDREERGNNGGLMMLIGIILALFTPIVATIIQLAVSRKREYLADASGALLTRDPESLALALTKISSDRSILKTASNATAHLYIINPFKGKQFGVRFSGLFETHPLIEERIKILRSM